MTVDLATDSLRKNLPIWRRYDIDPQLIEEVYFMNSMSTFISQLSFLFPYVPIWISAIVD
jgi:hypothetical protein